MSDAISSANALRSIDDLEQSILGLCAEINSVTYRLLVEVREFDRRAGWISYGHSSCAEWLASRCAFGLSAAREKVRVAHALATLPVMSGVFASGKLCYAARSPRSTRRYRPTPGVRCRCFAIMTAAR